jgi:RimJ/RimL family protein N-acetyltransferase
MPLEHWGDGTARLAHDAVLELFRSRGIERARLRVFRATARGRRFYEKLGWTRSGPTSQSSFPPHAELLHYERTL